MGVKYKMKNSKKVCFKIRSHERFFKKFLLYFSLMMVCSSAWAHFPISVIPNEKDGFFHARWTPIQLGVYTFDNNNSFQLFPGKTDVYGVSVGLLNLNQESSVVSFAPFANAIKKNYFLKTSFLFTVSDENYGIQMSFINFSECNYGISLGVMNLDLRELNSDEDEDNFSYLTCGLQIGLINSGSGFQIGLLNQNPRGIFPYMPLFNFPCRKPDCSIY